MKNNSIFWMLLAVSELLGAAVSFIPIPSRWATVLKGQESMGAVSFASTSYTVAGVRACSRGAAAGDPS